MADLPLITVTEITDRNPILQFNTQILIFWQLEGSGLLQSNSNTACLGSDELYIISPFTSYCIGEMEGKALLFNIKSFQQSDADFSSEQKRYISCPVRKEDNTIIKRSLAQIFQLLQQDILYKEPLLFSYYYRLMFELNCICSEELHSVAEVSSSLPLQNGTKILDILTYINENYTKKITLSDLSEHFFLSQSYLSHQFHKIMKTTFGKYLTIIRLSHAYDQLMHTSDTIETIAFANGFSSTHAFSSAFTDAYQMTPAKYRKLTVVTPVPTVADSMSFLSSYLEEPARIEFISAASPFHQKSAVIDYNACVKKLDHPVLGIFHAGNASQLLKANVQTLIRETLNNMHIPAIYVTRLLNEEMSIYQLRAHQAPYLNFQNLDALCDFLFSLEITPYFGLEYMPRHLSQNKTISNFMELDFLSMPVSIDLWNFLIRGIIEHISEKYGINKLKSCRFCVWSAPNVRQIPFYLCVEDYFSLYKNTYFTIKSFSTAIPVGLPRLEPEFGQKNGWLTSFLEKCDIHNCKPDFIGYTFYAMEKSSADKAIAAKMYPSPSTDENALSSTLNQIRTYYKTKHLNFDKTFIYEWNFTFSAHILNDTIFKALYVIKNCVEHITDSFALGCMEISDFTSIPLYDADDFHGWHGIFTSMGIPKASYYAYEMLHQLGDTLIHVDRNWCITKKGHDIQILLFHYQHFKKAPLPEMRYLQDYNEYFDMNQQLNCQLTLTNLPHRRYSRFTTTLSKNSGSSYDFWIKMGHPKILTAQISNYITTHSAPDISTTFVDVSDGKIEINETLYPLEARLIILSPV